MYEYQFLFLKMIFNHLHQVLERKKIDQINLVRLMFHLSIDSMSINDIEFVQNVINQRFVDLWLKVSFWLNYQSHVTIASPQSRGSCFEAVAEIRCHIDAVGQKKFSPPHSKV